MMDPFVQLPKQPFVVCKICKYAYVADEVITHLRAQHDWPLNMAKKVASIIQDEPSIMKSQDELREWELPGPYTEPIPYIAAPVNDGLGCNECDRVIRNIKGMQKHYKAEHGWVNQRKPGKVKKEVESTQPPLPWRSNVRCQRLFNKGVASRWFEVGREQAAGTESAEQQSMAAFIERIQREDDEWAKADVADMIEEGDNKWEANRWLNRTGWARHLDGFDRDALRETMEAAQEDEPVLQQMCEVLQRVMDLAYEAAVSVAPGSAELFEIERIEAQGAEPRKPFVGQMESNAWTKYKGRWVTLMCIWQRIELWEEDQRPDYKMTIRQRTCWDKLVAAASGTVANARQMVEQKCLDWIISILDHPLKSGDDYESILISGLAVMGLGEGGRWVEAGEYTAVYSAVIKVARMMVLYESILERRREISRLSAIIRDREAEEAAVGLFRIVRKKVRRFMTRMPDTDDADPTPMNWIINTRTYGMRIRYETPGGEMIDWRGDQIVCGQVRVRMSQLTDLMHNLVASAGETLGRLTMVDGRLQDSLPRIPWSSITDRHGERALGHSFMTNELNEGWLEAGRHWVMRRIQGSERRQKEWMVDSMEQRYPYRGPALRRYGREFDEFREKMWVLMHLTGGQPARGPEILGIRLFNTANGGVRNVFIHEDMVCFVTMYHKEFRKSDEAKVIHRYVPREVRELLVWYMWLTLPFWQAVQGRMKGQRRRSAFLWADEVMGEAKKIQEEGDGRIEREEEEARVFMQWYRERKWRSDRVRRVLGRYSKQFTGQQLNIADWRQIAIGISNRYLNKAFGGNNEDEEEEDDDGEGGMVDSVYDLQAGHGSHVAGLIYARLLGQGDLGTLHSRNRFRHVSQNWHRLFELGSADRMGHKRRRTLFEEEQMSLRQKRFDRLQRTDISGVLRQMMGEKAAFRGLQRKVIEAVLRGEWPILQITPTGGGKSLTFMLPAYCAPDGVTIVITPLVALENNMVKRCEATGIDSYVWKSRGVAQRTAALVFVTPESAVGKGFRQFVERLHGQQKLDRVVVDECHTLLEWTKEFRPRMGILGERLQEFGVPVICLTATMKPSDEWRFHNEMGFDAGRVRVFREVTTRKNIRYRVAVVDSRGGEGYEGGEDEAVMVRVCEIVREWMEEKETGKVIVYGGTIERVKAVAEELGCVGYWRGAGTAAEKAGMMEDWEESGTGMKRLISATNALGLGVDVADVRLVVHFGMPRELRGFVQESGRAGRDRQASESVVVVSSRWLEQIKGRREKAKKGDWEEDAVEYVVGSRCRREVLDREMDGNRMRIGCEEDEESCDVCERQGLWYEEGLAEGWENRMRIDFEASEQAGLRVGRQVEGRRMQESEEVGEFIRLVDDWDLQCGMCLSMGIEGGDHELKDCPEKGTEAWEAVVDGRKIVEEEMFKKRRFAEYSGCFDCGLPQAMCWRWMEAEDDGRMFRRLDSGWCQYNRVLVTMFVGLQMRGHLRGWDSRRAFEEEGLGEREISGDEFYTWLGELIEWGGMQASRICRVVYRLSVSDREEI